MITLRPLYVNGKVAVAKHDIKGLCVFASVDLKPDELIITCPVSFVGFADIKAKSPLNAYPMWWNNNNDCIAFGEINLLNHSTRTNIVLRRDRKNRLIRAYAKNAIKKGTELTIQYQCKLWFSLFKEKIRVSF